MTDSESDAGIIHVRNRLLELMYSTDAVFSVDQLARILGVDESRVLHELRHSHVHDVVYDPVDGTVRVRKQQRAAAQSDGGGGGGGGSGATLARTAPGAVEPRYGSDGYFRNRASGSRTVASKNALRKTKYRRPGGTHASSVGGDNTALPKGRVGYVCVADEFCLSELETHYRAQGYYTKFDFDVLHIRFSDKEMSTKEMRGASTIATHSSRSLESATVSHTNNSNNNNTGNGAGGEKAGEWTVPPVSPHPRKAGFDLFVFEYGAIVWWGFDQRFFKIVENDFMLPNSSIARHMVNRYMTQLVSENYPVWCTYTLARKDTLEPDEDFRERLRFDHFVIPFGRGDFDTSNVSMLCASHALAQSAKIDYLELKVQELTESCSPLPRELREKGHATITERRLLQLRGEVLSYRLMLKSGSNLMDEPDFFWENAHLKPIFQATKECFEIAERVEALDNKLDAANEILSMLAEEFSQRHGARLEWIVIWLVFVEVVIGVLELLINVKPWFYRRA